MDFVLRRNNVILLMVFVCRDVRVDILEVYVFKVKILLLVKYIIFIVIYLYCIYIGIYLYML